MPHTRRTFIKGSAAAVALAALKPAWLGAQEIEALHGFSLTPAGMLNTRTSAAIAASPLSVGFETLDRQHFDPVKTYPYAAKLGVKWARCQTGWARTEQTRGQYDFGWLDEVVDGLLQIGIQPWFNLGYGNPLYTPQADATAVGWVPVFDEAALVGWKNYADKIADHFRDRVRHYEIWNEPNITNFWKPGKPDAASYVKLVAQTAPLIRQRVPGAVIIGGGYSSVPLDFFRLCLEAGMATHVDKVSYHPYRPIPEQNYEADVQAMRELLAKHGAARMGLWQGENGCPSKQGGTGALHEGDWNETRQAKWLVRRILSDLRLEIELTSYFLIVDLLGYRGSANWKGLLHGEDYTPKQSYYAFQNLCTLFDAETHKSDLPVKTVADAMTVSFLRRNEPLYAYWRASDLMQDVASQRVRVEIKPLEKPALLDPLTGQIHRITAFDGLPLVDYPLLIANESLFA